MPLSDPIVEFQLTSAISSTVAIISTLYRIYNRKSKPWLDDAFALCALTVLFVQIGATFTPLTPSSGVMRYYLMITTFYLVVWLSRLSILFSVIRIDPSKTRRFVLLIGGIIFVFVCGFLIAQLYWTCEPEKEWKTWRVPQCELSEQVAITQLIFDTIADLLVLVVPLQLLYVLQDRWLRSRLMIIFSTCMLTTIVSLVHAIFILTLKGPAIVIVALLASAISLIVCNIPVIVTAVFHCLEHSPPRLPTSNHSSGQQLTTPGQNLRHESPRISTSILLSDPAMSILVDREHVHALGLPARPSSVMLKPDGDYGSIGIRRGSYA